MLIVSERMCVVSITLPGRVPSVAVSAVSSYTNTYDDMIRYDKGLQSSRWSNK